MLHGLHAVIRRRHANEVVRLAHSCRLLRSGTPPVMQGLDYVMAQACQHGLRVVLTLTNYLTAYGGMQTWVQWFGGKSVQEFYTNPTIV